MKSENSLLNIFVKKISENMGEILTKDEISRIWILSGGSKSKMRRAMTLLLGKKSILSVAQGIYKVLDTSESLSVQQDYWKIIQKLIKLHAPSGAIIGGEKALELLLGNYSLPDTLILYTRDTTKRIRLFDGREVHFRVLISGEKTGKKNLYRLLLEGVNTMERTEKLIFLSKETAILDALSLRSHEKGVEESSILRFLRDFHSSLQREVLGNLIKYRYIRALNRLRVIARDNGYDDLYKKTLDIIRDEGGGCYLHL